MLSSQPMVRIAILDADIPVPAVRSTRGEYSDVFANLLSKASKPLATGFNSPTLSFKGYNVMSGEYPSDLAALDGILVTGSSASAYEDKTWIIRLNKFIQDTYATHPHIRFFGSCFGHQIICQALLAPYGAHVTKDPKGWEIGVHPVRLTSEFTKSILASVSGESLPLPETLRFQFIHADHVVLPSSTSLPQDWVVMGSSDHCAVQGVLQPGRVLTYQGHFEFDRFINAETFNVFGAEWNETAREAAFKSIDADDDAEITAEIVARFFLDGMATSRLESGLLTPPEEG